MIQSDLFWPIIEEFIHLDVNLSELKDLKLVSKQWMNVINWMFNNNQAVIDAKNRSNRDDFTDPFMIYLCPKSDRFAL